MSLIGGCGGLVGVYGTFGSVQAVVDAVNLGWPGVGDIGGLGIPNTPYVTSQGEDQHVQDAYTQIGDRFWWLSFWTVSWPVSGDTFYNAGYQGGRVAAQTIDATLGTFIPRFVVLDPEGYNNRATNASQWADFINGFADGVHSVDGALPVAFYSNQSDYTTYDLASINISALIAVSPIRNNSPFVSGGNIVGYIAYTASCPVAPDVSQVESWGARWNTVQFQDNGADCGPS